MHGTKMAVAGSTGRISRSNYPGVLALVTGSPLNAYEALEPGHPLYDDFLATWCQQDDWDDQTHYTYWRSALRVWPTARVNRAELLALWVWSWRRSGLTDAEIADRLCLDHDSLRRMGVLRRADELGEPREREWLRAPRVVATEVERPNLLDTWYDPRLRECWPDSAQRRTRAEAALTRSGPRGRPEFA